MQDIAIFMQHHWQLSLGLIIVLFILVILEFIKNKHGAKRLSPQQVIQQMNHQNAMVVDVRNIDAFANGHIVGSTSLPLRELEEKIKKIEKYITQPMIITCSAGLESPRAATILTKKGYNVFILNGGIKAWQQAGMPLVKE